MSASLMDVLAALSNRIVCGASLEEALDFIYAEFERFIPYDRIGFAEIDNETQMVHAHWFKSHRPLLLGDGYSAPLAGSSLELVLQYGMPRILNDLPAYLRAHPESHSTELIVREGIRSSMTCPLHLAGKPFGFLFFSSVVVGAYREQHVKVLKVIGGQLALLLEISRRDNRLESHFDHGFARRADHSRIVEAGTSTAAYSAPAMRTTEANRPSISRPLADLKPGARLSTPVLMKNGRVLVATGVALTAGMIARLNTLHENGFVLTDTVDVQLGQ